MPRLWSSMGNFSALECRGFMRKSFLFTSLFSAMLATHAQAMPYLNATGTCEYVFPFEADFADVYLYPDGDKNQAINLGNSESLPVEVLECIDNAQKAKLQVKINAPFTLQSENNFIVESPQVQCEIVATKVQGTDEIFEALMPKSKPGSRVSLIGKLAYIKEAGMPFIALDPSDGSKQVILGAPFEFEDDMELNNCLNEALEQDLNVQIEANTVIYEEDGSVGYEASTMRCTILK